LEAALKPSFGSGQSPVRGSGAKPSEADEFLRVKGGFFLNYNNEHIKKICKNFQREGRTSLSYCFNNELVLRNDTVSFLTY
jgi:hypothetical protein